MLQAIGLVTSFQVETGFWAEAVGKTPPLTREKPKMGWNGLFQGTISSFLIGFSGLFPADFRSQSWKGLSGFCSGNREM
jgi:hypothetical protein